MADAPLSRGKFLRSLGSSVTGLALGKGLAAAQVLADRLGSIDQTVKAVPAVSDKNLMTADPIIRRGPSTGNRIALTFDDGPTPGVTDRILDELKQRHLLATFFMIGNQVSAAPELARRVLAEGHEIGNHTLTHPKLNTLPDQKVDAEIRQTQETIIKATGHRPVWFRPPYDAFRTTQAPIPRGQGLGIVSCDVQSRDWAQPGEDQIIETILSLTKAGSIITCHDMHQQTANCIGKVLDKLVEQKFNLVTLSTFLPPS